MKAIQSLLTKDIEVNQQSTKEIWPTRYRSNSWSRCQRALLGIDEGS